MGTSPIFGEMSTITAKRGKGICPRLVAGLLLAASLPAQTIKVYSEFRRVDPFGEIVPADSTGRPREILSPLLARNSHATFHLVVQAPPGRIFYLYVTQDPKDALNVTVYKEMYRKRGKTWMPDRLLPVTLPYTSRLPDRYHGLEAQSVECFLLDVWVPADAPTGIMKLDPQVNVGSRWAIYPMEVRIAETVVPKYEPREGSLPRVTAGAGAAALGPLKDYLCGTPERGRNGPISIRQLIRRNVMEDMALARSLERQMGADALAAGILKGLGADRASFCSAREINSPLVPEWYLPGRDFLYQGAID